jgi:hypothetical protein
MHIIATLRPSTNRYVQCERIKPATSCLVGEYSHHYTTSAVIVVYQWYCWACVVNSKKKCDMYGGLFCNKIFFCSFTHNIIAYHQNRLSGLDMKMKQSDRKQIIITLSIFPLMTCCKYIFNFFLRLLSSLSYVRLHKIVKFV